MAAASCMDPKKVRAVRIAVSRLEQLDPEVIPAVMAVAQCSTDVVAVQQLKRLVQEWGQEMELLVQTLDSMTDPAIFINVTEQRIRQIINVIRGCLSERDIPGLKYSLRKLLAHARHMIQVATQVVDHHFDPIFRNGLLVFIQSMTEARRSLKEAGQAILEDLAHPRLADTLQRRMNLLVDTTSDLRQGLKGDNHVDVLNPVRENVRNRPHLVSKVVTGKKRSELDVLLARSKEHASQPKPLKLVQEPMVNNVNKESMMSSQAAIPGIPTSSIAGPRTCTAFHTTSTVVPTSSTVVPETSTIVPTASTVVPTASTVVSATSTVVPTASSVVPATSTSVPTTFTSITTASTITCMDAVLNDAVVTNHDNIYYTSKPTLQTGNKVKDVDAQLTVSSSTNGLTKQQKGEVSRLVQVCGNSLVSAAVAGDATALAEMNGDLLGWTAHLVETALCLLDHCHHVSWQREMQELTVNLGSLAPQVIEMARFVLAGDMGQSDALKALVDSWIDVCNRLRILIDVATGDWLVLMEQVIQTVSAKDPTSIKHLLGQVDCNFREMKQLLRKAQKLEGCHVPAGTQIIQFLSNTQSELENVTATLKTAADCMSTSSTAADDKNAIMRTQLVQRGREWCTLMTCVVAEFDYMADILTHAGQSILGIPATVGINSPVSSSSRIFSSCDNKVAALIETETIRLKDMLTCLSSSDSSTRKRCEDLKESLSEIMKEVTEIAQNPVDSISPQAQLFARLDAGMARSHWTEKALETEQLIRRHCLKFSAPVNNLLILATATSTSGTNKEAVQTEASALADKLKNATQKILQAIQLSSELPQRATVRHCLDDLNILLAMITESAALCASEAGSRLKSKETELYKAGVQWGAKVYHLISVLRRMSDIKPGLVEGLERQFSGQSYPQPLRPVLPNHKFDHTTAQPKEEQRVVEPIVMQTASPGSSCEPVLTAVMSSPYRRSTLYASWLTNAKYLSGETTGWEEDDDNYFVRTVQGMARICQQMADFSHGRSSLKDSSEMALLGLTLAASGKELVTFARCLQAMCQQHRLAEEVQHAGEKIATHSTQLRIVASVLHNAPDNPEGDCILARNATNLVQAVQEMFSVAEGVSVANLLEPREGIEGDKQVVDLLTRWQKKLASYRIQQSKISDVDELGLRRMEIHSPPSLINIADCSTSFHSHK